MTYDSLNRTFCHVLEGGTEVYSECLIYCIGYYNG